MNLTIGLRRLLTCSTERKRHRKYQIYGHIKGPKIYPPRIPKKEKIKWEIIVSENSKNEEEHEISVREIISLVKHKPSLIFTETLQS